MIEAGGELSDDEIVRRVVDGDRPLFELLMRRHNQRVYRAARAILGDDAEAEDVMQDAYVRAYSSLASFEHRARFSTWITRIAVNEAIARARRRGRYQALDPNDPSLEGAPVRSTKDNPEQHVVDRELNALVERAVDALPDSFREVFMLRAVEELSTAETAACLAIAEETVKTRLFRARALLQQELVAHAEGALPTAFTFGAARCDRVVAQVLSRLRGPFVGSG